MKNRERGVPNSRALAKRPLFNKFPEERPIFWGPGQLTKFPDEYEEPDPGFTPKTAIQVPRVTRFLFGQHRPANVFRWIYLGSLEARYCRYTFACPVPTTGMPIRDVLRFGPFIFDGFEIADDYGANMSTLELLDLYLPSTSNAFCKEADTFDTFPWFWMPLFSTDFVGEVRSTYTDPFSSPPGAMYSIVDFTWNTGSASPEPTIIVELDSGYPSPAFDPVQRDGTEKFWDVRASVSNPGGAIPFWFNRRRQIVHVYLQNFIFGGTQTNRLLGVLHGYDIDDPPTTDTSVDTINPGGQYQRAVTGLILEP
jgi:hypothetical protein